MHSRSSCSKTLHTFSIFRFFSATSLHRTNPVKTPQSATVSYDPSEPQVQERRVVYPSGNNKEPRIPQHDFNDSISTPYEPSLPMNQNPTKNEETGEIIPPHNAP